MPEITDLSEQPLAFNAESSKEKRLGATAFRGRVPVVFAFVGAHGPQADSAIIGLDRALIRFGERRIQLLVVVDGYPTEVAARLGVTVPLITDDGLAKELDAEVDDQGRISSVILGNDGRVLDVVRQLPADDQASAILVTVDRLAAEFPDRFGVLPEIDENAETIDDPTNIRAIADAPSLRQQLHWLTGDRASEAKALADTVGAPASAAETVLGAAKQAVSDAHGDSSVAERDPVTSDVAVRDDVLGKLDHDQREPGDADMSESGVLRTRREVAEDEPSDDREPDALSKETLANVREHYTAMTDEGATMKGEGEIDGVVASGAN